MSTGLNQALKLHEGAGYEVRPLLREDLAAVLQRWDGQARLAQAREA